MIASVFSNPATLIAVPSVLVCGAAGLMWWRRGKAAAKPEAAPASQEAAPAAAPAADVTQIQASFRDAESKLRLSPKLKGTSISDLPVFLVIGPSGVGKTSLILQSGIDPELLAGQVYQGSQILPTRGLNIWLARQTIFIEIPASLAKDESAAKAIVKHLTPKGLRTAFRQVQPTRGIILCTDFETLNSAKTSDEVTALARPWNELLSLVAGALGVQSPVYVLFTKTDAMAGFQEFFSNLGAGDLAQALGATIAPFRIGGQGVYAEETARVLTEHFLKIVYSLSDSRVPLLSRESDRARIPAEYQFPRDSSKFQKNLVQFLVDVARPSQLQASVFLRGFYFGGTRKVVVDRSDNSAVAAVPMPSTLESATSVISAEQLRTMMSPRSPEPARGGSEVIEWLFLPALLERVILRDRSAHRASASSSRTDYARAAALAVVGLLGVALLVGTTVSYIRNRSFERELATGAEGLTGVMPPEERFVRLDRMRKPVERLLDYRTSPPLSMRWGLYRGADLIGPAQASYCAAIRDRLLPQLVQKMNTRLTSLRQPGVDHTGDFAYLKAYMMVTAYPQRAEETFLSQELFDLWNESGGKGATPEISQILPAELRLYGALLPIPDAQSYCVVQPSAGVIANAQDYLRMLNANDRYQSLLQQAGRGLAPIDYNKLFPNDAVADAKIVPGWFTRRGWTKMQELLQHPEESLKADAWVLGESKDLTPQELSSLAAEYSSRYFNEYAGAWKEFLNSAKVAPYANSTDAVMKLDKMSGQHSVLINLIGLTAEHTAPIEKINAVFQPANVVSTNPAEYLQKLESFKNRVAKYTQSTGPTQDQDLAEVRSAATAAQDAVGQIALDKRFKGETDQITKEILLKPITQFDARPDPRQANGGGSDLCRSYDRLARLLPFNPRAQQGAPIDDVQHVFQPEKGQMWQLYDQALRDSLDCADSGCILKSNPKFPLSRAFINFFNGLNRWSHLFYGGSQDLIVRLQLRATPLNHLKQVEIVYGDQRIVLSAGAEFQTINWDPRRTQKLQVSGVFEDEPQTQGLFPPTSGPWALFEWLFNAEPGSGGSDGFTWLPRAGTIRPAQLRNGNTEKYKIEIRYGDGIPSMLDLRSLGLASCVLPVPR